MAITAASLAATNFGGLINEDVMQQIWDISNIPLPLQDLIGTGRYPVSDSLLLGTVAIAGWALAVVAFRRRDLAA